MNEIILGNGILPKEYIAGGLFTATDDYGNKQIVMLVRLPDSTFATICLSDGEVFNGNTTLEDAIDSCEFLGRDALIYVKL